MKLKSFGLGGNLLDWIVDFLSGRSQVVKVGSVLSSETAVTSGVAQGSVLGPILFLLFIYDLVDEIGINLSAKLFADDVKIYVEFNGANKPDSLQVGLDKLCTWANKWQLGLSINKCFILHIGRNNLNHTYNINNIALPAKTEAVDLGITVDQNLRFDKHIAGIVAKAHQRAALILRCFKTREADLLFRAFAVYVRPLLEYCSAVWNPKYVTEIRTIESVQRRFTKRIYGLHCLSYSERLLALHAESLELRRLKADLLMVF